MDIIKQLQTVFWFLVGILLISPALQYFNIPVGTTVRKLLLLPPKEAKLERNEINEEDINEAFQRGIAQSVDVEQQKKDIKKRINILEDMAKTYNEQPYTPDLPFVFDSKPVTRKVKWIGPPKGFFTGRGYNFMIYRENQPVTPKVVTVLDKIHGNLILDLLPFSMAYKPNRILIMLFGEPQSYQNFTQRPAWSGASCDIESDTLYVIENNKFYPLSVHELTHLYFDGFFLPAKTPLWLSEGMAVYMQSKTSEGKPPWLENSLQRFKKGEYMPFEKFVEINSLKDFTADQTQMWYAQAYSMVSYLMHMRSKNEYYVFCVNLKNNMPDYQALYRAYGLPFTRFEVLEDVWAHDMSSGIL